MSETPRGERTGKTYQELLDAGWRAMTVFDTEAGRLDVIQRYRQSNPSAEIEIIRGERHNRVLLIREQSAE